ncbi:MAG: CPBP family glutamic-type intramembrane protease [Planctomycetota bacterium]
MSRPVLPQPALAPGLLAAAPLFALYEWGLAAGGVAAGRNGAELVLTAVLRPAGPHLALARGIAVAALVAGAFLVTRRREAALGRALLATVGQGALAALVLGPLLVGLTSLLDVSPLARGFGASEASAVPALAQAARVGGAAVWEELLYRLGGHSLAYLALRRLLSFLGATGVAGHLVAELGAILGSSLAFAALHLAAFTAPIGVGGEPFEGPVFLWRCLAGILLAGLYRWRGLGVAAWAHGLFNLALLLGADPGVFQAGP